MGKISRPWPSPARHQEPGAEVGAHGAAVGVGAVGSAAGTSAKADVAMMVAVTVAVTVTVTLVVTTDATGAEQSLLGAAGSAGGVVDVGCVLGTADETMTDEVTTDEVVTDVVAPVWPSAAVEVGAPGSPELAGLLPVGGASIGVPARGLPSHGCLNRLVLPSGWST